MAKVPLHKSFSVFLNNWSWGVLLLLATRTKETSVQFFFEFFFLAKDWWGPLLFHLIRNSQAFSSPIRSDHLAKIYSTNLERRRFIVIDFLCRFCQNDIPIWLLTKKKKKRLFTVEDCEVHLHILSTEYGLKQAPRAWFDLFNTCVLNMKFDRSADDLALILCNPLLAVFL